MTCVSNNYLSCVCHVGQLQITLFEKNENKKKKRKEYEWL